MLILNKSEVWNIHVELSKVFFFFSSLLFSPPSSSSLPVDLTFFSINYHAQEVFSGRGAAIRLNHLDKAAWPNYTRAPPGFDVAEKQRDRGKLHSHIMVMIWFNPATKLYVACLKKMLTLITEVRRGAGWDRVEEGWAEGARGRGGGAATAAGGSFESTKCSS